VVVPNPAHDGTGNRIGVKAGAGKGRKGVVGFQNAVAKVADLGLEAVNIVGVHDHSIAWVSRGVKLNTYMKHFKSFLLEEQQIISLILEGKEQHQIIKQFGLKIMKRMTDENNRNRVDVSRQMASSPGLLHYDRLNHDMLNHSVGEDGKMKLNDRPNFNVNQMHDYIMGHFGFDKIPEHINKDDPQEMAERNKHVNWMLTRYAQGAIGEDGGTTGIGRREDVHHRAEPILKRFHNLVKEGKLQSESLAKFRHLGDLEKAVNNADPLDSSAVAPDEYTKIAENEHWHVVIPHTAEAACHFGHGTSWCTTSGAFKGYNDEGPLHIAIPKAPAHKNEKYQLHVESKQFMDKDDQPVSRQQFEGIHRERPMPTVISAMAKIHHNYPADQLSAEETAHITEAAPETAVKMGLGPYISKEHVMSIIKNSNSKNDETVKKLVGETKHIQQEDLHHIFSNLKGVEGGSQKYPIGAARALIGAHGWDFKPTYNSTTSYTDIIRPEHLRAAYHATDHHLNNKTPGEDKYSLGELKRQIALHPNVPEDVLEHARNNNVSTAYQNPNTTAAHIKEYFEKHKRNPGFHGPNDTDSTLRAALKNPNFPTHFFDSLMRPDTLPKRDTGYGKEYNWNGINVNSEDLKRHRETALQNPSIPHEHIHRVLDNPNSYSGREYIESLTAIINNPSSTEEHVVRAIKSAPIDENTSYGDRKNKYNFTHRVIGRYNSHANGEIPENVFNALLDVQERTSPGSIESLVKHPQFNETHGNILRNRFNAKADGYIRNMIDRRLTPTEQSTGEQ